MPDTGMVTHQAINLSNVNQVNRTLNVLGWVSLLVYTKHASSEVRGVLCGKGPISMLRFLS